MHIGVPRETDPLERRTALVPAAASKLIRSGFTVSVESGAATGAGFTDADYTDVGATVCSERSALLGSADILLRVGKPPVEEVSALRKSALHVSFLDPYNERGLVESLASHGVSAVSMEMVPRTTRAQKMDALSSQANLAGYVMVMLAARKLDSILPMMMTPSGTISPARVFVIGAGVAGLQAIATAKRLGARVEAFDVRNVVAEQVQSLGAKFVDIDLGETGQTKDGYAKALTDAQLEMQREGMKAVIAQSDIVITTAQVFGRPAPRVLTADMVAAMKPGGVIVDMAVGSGGNVEGSKPDEDVEVDGVTIIGVSNLPSEVARNASEMYSNNLVNLLTEYWNQEDSSLNLDRSDDILAGCLLTQNGIVVNESIRALYEEAS